MNCRPLTLMDSHGCECVGFEFDTGFKIIVHKDFNLSERHQRKLYNEIKKLVRQNEI